MKNLSTKIYAAMILSILIIAAVFPDLYGFSFAIDPGSMHLEPLCAMIGSVYVTDDIDRAKLENFKNAIKSMPQYRNYDLTNFDIRLKNLRLLNDLSEEMSVYKFDIKNGYQLKTNDFLSNLEVRADDYKVYFPYALRVCYRKINSTGTLQPIFTYPDRLYFNNADEQNGLLSIINGTTDFFTDTVQRINGLTNDVFEYTPETQLLAGPILWNGYGPSLGQKGYQLLNPVPIIDSQKKNVVQVNLFGPTTGIEGAEGTPNILQVDLMTFEWDPQSQMQFTTLPNLANGKIQSCV
jgi:hypothetical protein